MSKSSPPFRSRTSFRDLAWFNRLLNCFLGTIAVASGILTAAAANPSAPEEVAPGVWRIRFGQPDSFTPTKVRVAEPRPDSAFDALPPAGNLSIDLSAIQCRITDTRTVINIPSGKPGFTYYGFGIDPDCFKQNGLMKRPRVSDSSEGEANKLRGPGSGHAPAPLYFSTNGFGVFIDTARVAEFHMARLKYRQDARSALADAKERDMLTLEGLYDQEQSGRDVLVDIPGARGVDVYVFAGPDIRTAVQRWNLFSGGGAAMPIWGCGVSLRMLNGADTAYVERMCKDLREKQISVDVIGLEPRWQSRFYPCSFSWSPERFPEPEKFISDLNKKGFKISLWEHSYVHAEAPFYNEILPYTASVLSMDGLVVDPLHPESKRIYQGYHEKELIAKGIAGFKIDECDRNNIKRGGGFSFPDLTVFPSGIDGEQMGQSYGYLLQRNMLESFRKFNKRTLGNARASGPLAAPLPFSMYSDTYALPDYLRGLCNASFSGFLWSPEVREAPNMNQFQRRLAVVTFSHVFQLNPYYNKLPLWENYKVSYGNKDPKPLPLDEQKQAEVALRYYTQLRMKFVPYLYSAYRNYMETGMPPIRALVLDFPNDPNVRTIDDAFLFGPSLLVAPFLFEHKGERQVYLPAGCDWYDFSTGQSYKGGQAITVKAAVDQEGIENIPLFVKADSLIPLADPVPCVNPDTIFNIRVRAYGPNPAPFELFEDDGVSYNFEKGEENRVYLTLRNGKISTDRSGTYKNERYHIDPVPIVPTTASN